MEKYSWNIIRSGSNGIVIIESVNRLLSGWNLTNKSVLLTPTAHNMAIDGLLKSCKNNTLAIDFGHTFVKSSYIDNKGCRVDLNPYKIELNSQNINNDILYVNSVFEKVASNSILCPSSSNSLL